MLSLEDRLEVSEIQEFSQQDIQAGRYENRLYWLPVRSDIGLLYYRKDWLTQIGVTPPETFAELEEISQTLQEEKITNWGYLWQGEEYEGLSAVFVEILQGYGGFWLDVSQEKVGLDRTEAINAVKFLQGTLGGISPPQVREYTEDDAIANFLAGNAAFLRHWPAGLEKINGSPLGDNIGLQPMTLHQPQTQGGACKGSWGFSIAKNSRHTEAAWEAISYLSSEEGQRRFIVETGFIPSRTAILQDPDLQEQYPYYPKILQGVENAIFRPRLPEYAQISQILQRYLSLALSEQMTPEEAMAQAATETRELLGWES